MSIWCDLIGEERKSPRGLVGMDSYGKMRVFLQEYRDVAPGEFVEIPAELLPEMRNSRHWWQR